MTSLYPRGSVLNYQFTRRVSGNTIQGEVTDNEHDHRRRVWPRNDCRLK